MNIQEFKITIMNEQIPDALPLHLQALWHDHSGNWIKAHDLIDKLNDQSSSCVHAYLHRKEGDIWNADYWYSKAGKKRPEISLEEEWENLVSNFLQTTSQP